MIGGSNFDQSKRRERQLRWCLSVAGPPRLALVEARKPPHLFQVLLIGAEGFDPLAH